MWEVKEGWEDNLVEVLVTQGFSKFIAFGIGQGFISREDIVPVTEYLIEHLAITERYETCAMLRDGLKEYKDKIHG
jgi:hypothetical protein